MAEKMQRYEFYDDRQWNAIETETDNGEYIKYDDHVALLKKLGETLLSKADSCSCFDSTVQSDDIKATFKEIAGVEI